MVVVGVAQQEMLTSGASGRLNALISSVRGWKTFVGFITSLLLFLITPFRPHHHHQKRPVVVVKEDKLLAIGGGGRAVVRLPAKIVPRRMTVDQEVMNRRMMAIKRVREEGKNEDSTEKKMRNGRDFWLFNSPRGATLFTQSWSPLSTHLRGLVILLHGLNEHSGRYNEFAKQLNTIGIKVYGMDWIGHGGSDGLHGFVHSLDDVVVDLKAFLDHVYTVNPNVPCFFFAHSTGAAIVLKAALDPMVENRIRGLVLTSPAVGVQPSHPILSVIAPVVSFLLPRYQCSVANKPGTVVCRDPEALLAKYSDPLVYTNAIRVKTGYEILKISAYLQQNLTRLKTPFLVLHGSDDAVTEPEGSKRLYEEASSTDKMIKLYDGLLHDILFEPEKDIVMHDIIEWLNQRV